MGRDALFHFLKREHLFKTKKELYQTNNER
jgi:hypothetical protein